MEKITCKTEEEVKQIITELQKENPKLDANLIRKAIASCCLASVIVKKHESFISCVRERVKML